MKRMKAYLPVLCALFLGAAPLTVGAQTPVRFQTISLNFGIHVIKAEVAVTEPQRAQGLMYREKLGANEGMIFVAPEPRQQCMWMKNTLIPLSAAFLDEQGKIINIVDMAPQTTNSHCSKGPAKYVLEMNQGWFKRKNIKPGSLLDGLPKK